MKTQYPKVNISKLIKGVSYSFSTSLALSSLISLTLIIISIFNRPFQDNFGSGLFILFLFAFVAGLISLVTSVFVGIPVTIMLIKSGFDDEFISAVIGALVVFIAIYIFAGIDYSAIIFCLYGFCCAYGFMFGYKS